MHHFGMELPLADRGSYGLSNATPVAAKSVTLRVTSVRPWTIAVAAIGASRSARGSGT